MSTAENWDPKDYGFSPDNIEFLRSIDDQPIPVNELVNEHMPPQEITKISPNMNLSQRLINRWDRLSGLDKGIIGIGLGSYAVRLSTEAFHESTSLIGQDSKIVVWAALGAYALKKSPKVFRGIFRGIDWLTEQRYED